MAWRGSEGRAPRLPAVARAARSLPVRRALIIGGLTLAAWILGAAAPAFADALDTITDTADTGTRIVEEQTAEVTDLVETATPPVGSDPDPAPATDRQRIVDVDPLLDLVRTETDPTAQPPAESPADTAESARVADEDTGAPLAPRRASGTGSGGDTAGHGAAPATERSPETTAAPGSGESAPEPSAPAPAQPAKAQQQGPSFSGGALAGYLTHPPAAPRRDALTSTVRHSTAPPPRQHATDSFFSPD